MNKKALLKKSEFILIFIISIILVCVSYNVVAAQKGDEENIKIAFVGPISGKSAFKGQEMLNGIRMYIDKVNLEGGIKGKMIDLLIFDDENDNDLAAKKAKKIAYHTDALIVLGHRNSSTSMAGANVYKQAGISAITGTATADGITKDNPFYFRVVPNNTQQGKLLAYYSKEILNYSDMYIIYDDDHYGYNLFEAFEKAAQKLNIQIRHKWSFHNKNDKLDERIKSIVKDLSEKEKPEAIFLAAHDIEAAPIVKYMKEFDLDIPLIGGDSVGNRSFAKLFEKFPLEKKYPGFYTNGIYAVTYFIYDVANEQAQQFKHQFNKLYNIDPGGAAVSNYDVAGIAIEAIRKANISGNNIKEDRKRIRDYLASINNTERSFKGLTGHIYFDPDGNAMKSMATGTFFKQKLISAPVQVNHIADFRTISALKRSEEERDDILQIDDTYLQLTKVVYTGSDIIDIKDIDPAKKTCSLDFYLWFRFQGALDTENFQFVNAAEPIKIENPINEKRTDQFIYRLYRLKGSFKIDFLPYTAADSNKHIIGFSLYHKKLPREKLIMVADTANMGAPGDNPLVKTMEGPHILNFPSDWSINDISCFQDIITKSALGDPDYLNADKGEMTFSRLTTRIDVTKRAFTLRGIMPLILALIVSILSGVFLALSLFWEKKERYTNHSKKIWIAQNLSVLLLIIGLETIILKSFAGTRDNYLPELITKAFDILWWLTYATILINAVKHFIWLPLEKRTKRSVPTFLRRFTKFVIYALAIFGITAFVFDQRITSLLATSGVVAMIIGLAIQMNISNVFSGIAINIELPFRINDWVKIGSLDEGKVIDITWRTTRIQTREDSILSIPNSVASESPVLNYCYPNNRYRTSLTVHMDPAHPFEHVQKIIREAIDSSEEILKEPAPIVSFAGFTDWSAAYFVGFHVDDYLKKPFYTSSVWKTIFKHFKREGIVPLAKFNQPQEMRLINDKE